MLDIEELQHQLNTRCFGSGDRLLYLPTAESTNTVAMQLAQKRPDEGVVVLTDSQTAGKGRLGRRWVDMPGLNILSSILLRPLFPPHLLVMMASLAVVEAISQTCDSAATIKWPNDVLIAERKVAGILIETSHNDSGQLIAILGIGVNVNGAVSNIPEHLHEQVPLLARATTLETECGHPVSRERFLAHLLLYLETDYFALQQEASNSFATSAAYAAYESASRIMWERWRDRLSTLGRPIEVHQGNTIISGIAEDVNDNGELLLRRHSGELVQITWGDIGHIRTTDHSIR
ncbi:MAG: biotin--[acetyl-CoA-carboxylase] ligase [Chloroflexota bacterium]|nr:biotin--[acetyl-CoA-carboxylase] ligase [Chloroflexota bacterium]